MNVAQPTQPRFGARRGRGGRQIPPVLDQILNGGPCVSLPVARTCQGLPPEKRLFRLGSLNRTFIFKLPCPDGEIDSDPEAASRRPLDTGIYVPYDETDPARGGFAIYMRERRSIERFRDMLGITLDAPGGERDARVLRMLDELPSLDPFLLKDSFIQKGIDLDAAFTEMADADADGVRTIIKRQLHPLIARAMGGIALERRLERLVQGIFDPSMGEAKLLLSAFGVRPEDMPEVFSAWKGIAYYRSQIQRHARPLTEALHWLRSKEALPHDIPRHSHETEQILRQRLGVLTCLTQLLREIDGIFALSDRRFDDLAKNSDASPFRQFLKDSFETFWVLGQAAATIAHGAAAFRAVGWPRPERPSSEGFDRLLRNLDLASRRSPFAAVSRHWS